MLSLIKRVYEGKILKLGHHVNTDILHPSEFFSLNQSMVKRGFLNELHLHENYDNDNNNPIILVGGKNMGCGSSRETTAYSLKLNRVELVIAMSFSRIFYRNLVNSGIIPIELPELYSIVNDKERIKVDFCQNKIVTQNYTLAIPQFQNYIRDLLYHGGMIKYLEDKIIPSQRIIQ